MEKFYLGLDIGTDSVGIACTDEHYNLLRAKGKDLWAVRLFDEASDASARRAKRTSRRRVERRQRRIDFLQSVFAPFMQDKTFFLRLNNSGFHVEDKNEALSTQFALFADADYTDADFYNAYPTIFHLREALTKEPSEKVDLRLYYLALHHIVKYRGHFLFEGENVEDVPDIRGLFSAYDDCVRETEIVGIQVLDCEKAEAFKALALSDKGLTDKKKEAIALFGATSLEQKEWISLLLGSSASPKKLFGEEYREKYKEMKNISFKGLTDDDFEALGADLEEEFFRLLQAARAIYNCAVFEKVLAGRKSISEAMVALYEKHESDLKKLKNFVKENYRKEVYFKIFRSCKETANYANYVGYNQSKREKIRLKKCKNPEDFYAFLKKILKSKAVADEVQLQEILDEIEKGTFLPKILHADNGLFPHQINGAELHAILKNLCAQYPEFCEKGEDGYSAEEKIEKIFLFKIPYYVGPLNAFSKNAWFKRKEGKEGKITPWNFDEIVDKPKSNEEFIRRMTNKCTYLHAQDVLPKSSMYYQAFDTLNQLNVLQINGSPIDAQLKKEIFQNVFLRKKKAGVKQIKEYLVLSGKCTQEESKELILGGFDQEIGLKASMGSYIAFKEKFGNLVDEKPEIFENIILWHTLNTDKNLVEALILEKYGDVSAIKENVKWLKGLTSFKEFGRLSKRLLCELVGGEDAATGEVYTILERLYNTTYNFNQLLFSERYRFGQAVEEENAGLEQVDGYKAVENLYVSPMVRRGVWQALRMTEEYVKAVGRAPDKIFVEVTRADDKKERTVSRKNKLLALYKGLDSDCLDVDDLLCELNREETTDARLRQERLYLYFLQWGRCAYTGERIDLDRLSTDLYDVDHIMPRSRKKDDGIENKVLVKREKNKQKADCYPLPEGFCAKKEKDFWKILRKKNFMSEKKYALLTRTKPLTEEDFKEFVDRQIVVTNQTAKAVAELLKQKYDAAGTKIVYSKASNVNDFKQKYDIVKCRDTNDLHHARDAYLNIVTGNVFDTKFTSARDYFKKHLDDSWREYNLERLFDRPVENAWTGAADVAKAKSVAKRTSMSVTRYSYTYDGAFYDETVYKKDDGGVAAPRKESYPYNQIEKYGGFKKLCSAYFSVVEAKGKKDARIKTIESIPVLVEYKSRTNPDAVKEYLQSIGLKEPKILIGKLKIKTLLLIEGSKVWLAGKTGKQLILHNAEEWFTDERTDAYMKRISKYLDAEREGKISEKEKEAEEIPLAANRKNTTFYATREENTALYRKILDTLQKKSYQGLRSVRSFAEQLREKEEAFENLSTFRQMKVLRQIVRFMKCNAETADLSELGGGERCGTILIGKDITGLDISVVHQSPCGLIERIEKI